MNTTQLIVRHNDCMFDLWSSCVQNAEHYYEFLQSKVFSVTQKLNFMRKKGFSFSLTWVATGQLHRGYPLYASTLKDTWVLE